VRLLEVEPEESVRRLGRGELDLAVVLDWYNRPLSVPAGMAKQPLADDVVDVAVPADHRCAGRAEVDLEDFADDDWVTWPPGEFCHEWLTFTLRDRGIEPRLAHRAAEHHTQLALVAAGLGVAVAPRLGRGAVPEGVAIVPVRQTITRHVYALWRQDADRRPSIRAVVAALGEAAAHPAHDTGAATAR
ncbi:LysR family transcriptional regulator, partial [Streptomyces durbertensis]